MDLSKYKLGIRQDWLRDNVTVAEILAAENGDMDTIITICARGLIGPEGHYVGEEHGRELILKMKMGQFSDMMETLRANLESAAVP
jgi:hypothetical protein